MQATDIAAYAGHGQSPLWPLSPRFPGARYCGGALRVRCACAARAAAAAGAVGLRALPPTHTHTQSLLKRCTDLAVELIRAQLPTPTLWQLRLVSRAARDDLVDGRCTHLRRLIWSSDLWDVRRVAPRLRRLQRLTLDHLRSAEQCDVLAAFLARLAAGGASLRELGLGYFAPQTFEHFRDECFTTATRASVQRLAAAIAALAGLELVSTTAPFYPNSKSCAALLDVLGAAAGARATRRRVAHARVALHLTDYRPLRASPTAPLLGRIESLGLESGAAEWALPLFAKPAAAAALTALRSLAVEGSFLIGDMEPSVWRAPWFSQLTQLRMAGDEQDFSSYARGLAPGSLAALRKLRLSGFHPPAMEDLRALLAACDAAALRTLTLPLLRLTTVARLTEGLPALERLELDVADNAVSEVDPGESPEAYEALRGARLAPLTSLTLSVSKWLLAEPARLSALLSAPWAASLVELGLRGKLRGPRARGAPYSRAPLPALDLSGLPRLRALRLIDPHLKPGLLDQAAEAGWADEWAPRLREFSVSDYFADAFTLDALLCLPFSSRLEALAVGAHLCTGLGEAMDMCMTALPWLKKVVLEDGGVLSSSFS